MLASVPDHPTLRATITTLIEKERREQRLKAMRGQMPQRLTAAVAWLFHVVEHSYLLEFLMFDHLSVHVSKRSFFLPGSPDFALGSLVVTIGREEVRLDPIGLEDCYVWVRVCNPAHRLTRDLVCDLSDEHPCWMVAIEERGLRRLVQGLLPERHAALSEALFRDLLNSMLVGPQPVFTGGTAAVRQGLGRVLDRLTSEVVREKLALGVRSSASQFGQQLQLAAPAARDAVRHVLPTRHRLPSPRPEDEAAVRAAYRQTEAPVRRQRGSLRRSPHAAQPFNRRGGADEPFTFLC